MNRRETNYITTLVIDSTLYGDYDTTPLYNLLGFIISDLGREGFSHHIDNIRSELKTYDYTIYSNASCISIILTLKFNNYVIVNCDSLRIELNYRLKDYLPFGVIITPSSNCKTLII